VTDKPYYQALIQTPLGEMRAISDESALYLLEFENRKHLSRQIKGLKINTAFINTKATPIHSIEAELQLYFAKELKQFNTPLYLTGTVFQQQVWKQLQKIPYGGTQSYLQIAEAIGKPSAHRAVANANGANRFAIVIPCHRVINTSGELGGYAAGLAYKKWLLDNESAS
jgi:O-6-methylguanine DNA methyltransferase